MGRRSAVLTSGAAYWSSSVDCLEMIAARNPSVADPDGPRGCRVPCVWRSSGARTVGENWFRRSRWQALRAFLRPPGQRLDERQIGTPGHGWQHEATEAVHAHLLGTTIWPRLAPEERALIRSQGGPMSGVPFRCFPVARESRIESSSFRVLVLRRLWLLLRFLPQLPVWPSS